MNAAHLHIAVNHLPLFALLFGAALLIAGRWKGYRVLVTAGLSITMIAGLGAGAAYLTGEGAEEIVEEQVIGDVDDLIHEHEEVALFALWLTVVAAAVAAWALWSSRGGGEPPRTPTAGVIVLALAALALMVLTAWHGGKIGHPEIRSAAVVSSPASGDDD